MRLDPEAGIVATNDRGQVLWSSPPVDFGSQAVLAVGISGCNQNRIDRVEVRGQTVTVVGWQGERLGICPGMGGLTALMAVPKDRLPIGEVTLRLTVESQFGTDLLATSHGVLVDPPSPRPHPAILATAALLVAIVVLSLARGAARRRVRNAGA